MKSLASSMKAVLGEDEKRHVVPCRANMEPPVSLHIKKGNGDFGASTSCFHDSGEKIDIGLHINGSVSLESLQPNNRHRLPTDAARLL